MLQVSAEEVRPYECPMDPPAGHRPGRATLTGTRAMILSPATAISVRHFPQAWLPPFPRGPCSTGAGSRADSRSRDWLCRSVPTADVRHGRPHPRIGQGRCPRVPTAPRSSSIPAALPSPRSWSTWSARRAPAEDVRRDQGRATARSTAAEEGACHLRLGPQHGPSLDGPPRSLLADIDHAAHPSSAVRTRRHLRSLLVDKATGPPDIGRIRTSTTLRRPTWGTRPD